MSYELGTLYLVLGTQSVEGCIGCLFECYFATAVN
jgi:hypothetical protein